MTDYHALSIQSSSAHTTCIQLVMHGHSIRCSTPTCSLRMVQACPDVKRCAGIPVPTNVSAPAGDYKAFFTHDTCRKMYQAHAKKVLNRYFLLTFVALLRVPKSLLPPPPARTRAYPFRVREQVHACVPAAPEGCVSISETQRALNSNTFEYHQWQYE